LLCGVIGLSVASSLFVGLAVIRGLELLVALALIPISMTPSIVVALIRKRATRAESGVLLEHFVLSVATVTAALLLARQPVLVWLDLFVTSSCVLYLFGRLGCTITGCCHGQPSSLGIDYGPAHPGDGRCFPVQLLDGLAWLTALLIGIASEFAAPPGTATALCVIVYGVVRLGLESLRRDVRRTLLGLSESRWLSLMLIAGALGLLLTTREVSPPVMILTAVGVALALGLWFSARWWLTKAETLGLERHAELFALGRDLAARGPDDVLQRARVGSLSVDSSWVTGEGVGAELHVTISEADDSAELDSCDRKCTTSLAMAELAFEHIARGLGVPDPRPMVVETTPGVYMTRFTRHEGAPTVTPRGGPPAA
jgi:hypothetical protein